MATQALTESFTLTTRILQDSTGSTVPGSIWTQSSMLWMVIVGFIIAFVLAFAVGANDVANSFGTTVGANVLTMRSACILASIFETVGAVLLGAKVGETIRKGIIDVTVYNATEGGIELLMMGEVSAICGSAVWQLIATIAGLPVSGTHSIVGACIGFSLVAIGAQGINWAKLGFIISSWFISPVTSGIMSTLLYVFVKRYILEKDDPLENGLQCLPIFYAFTMGVNTFSILYSGAPLLGLDALPLWGIALITFGIMVVTAIVIFCFVVPRLRKSATKEIEKEELESKSVKSTSSSEYELHSSEKKRFPVQVTLPSSAEINANLTVGSSADPNEMMIRDLDQYAIEEREELFNLRRNEDNYSLSSRSSRQDSIHISDKKPESICSSEGDKDEDPPSVAKMFSFLQILTACFGSFAHGGNDVSNAIGPLIALWLIYQSGTVAQSAATPWYILVYGGIGIVFGLWILGRRVIKTIGKDLTKVTPSRGFCVELMTATTVLVASNIGIPVSTTHCKVGSVVSIGWYRSRDAVKWSMVRNIAIAWFVTVPFSALISALSMYFLMLFRQT